MPIADLPRRQRRPGRREFLGQGPALRDQVLRGALRHSDRAGQFAGELPLGDLTRVPAGARHPDGIVRDGLPEPAGILDPFGPPGEGRGDVAFCLGDGVEMPAHGLSLFDE
ncbi:hypothetical protein [Cryobacterium sp. TmT2-59]|uniref:hypothetical protein n=1 Tax=Cryobacterium sp. TmT2-59 TaxID=1259264 RepID=UPI001F541024|nr:hypothetical protein [Cryobacterium sp. TmT2-59]